MDFRPGTRRPHTPPPLGPAVLGYVGIWVAAGLILWALRG
jgi:hypothetical protein